MKFELRCKSLVTFCSSFEKISLAPFVNSMANYLFKDKIVTFSSSEIIAPALIDSGLVKKEISQVNYQSLQ